MRSALYYISVVAIGLLIIMWVILIVILIKFMIQDHKKKTTKEMAIKAISDRLYELSDKKDHGLCPPGTDAQVVVDELCDFFLGTDWYIVLPLPSRQANTEILYAIETKYWDKRRVNHV